jgi:hypothetical protein
MVESFLDERESAESTISEIINRRITALYKIKKESLYPGPRRGDLQKYSPALFRSWQKRYVTLENRTLKYFKGKELMGVLNFDLYSVSINQNRSKELVFEIEIADCERKF